MFEAASSEMEGFGDLDKVDLCFEYYPGKYAYNTGEGCEWSCHVLSSTDMSGHVLCHVMCHVKSCHVMWYVRCRRHF